MIADQIWAQSLHKTEIRYTKTNICRKHNEELTPAHIKTCDNFKDSGSIEELIQRLKKSNIREWHQEEIVKGLADAIKVTLKIHSLQLTGEVT